MIYTISNDKLTAKINDLGAELWSVKDNDGGYEYIWQGDEKYWGDRAPTLFPICGKLCEGKYTHEGKEYSMGGHGFAKKLVFGIKEQAASSITLSASATEETKKLYPFDFTLEITFTLDGNSLSVGANMINAGNAILPATFGAHPGFNVPMADGLKFEDYYFEFSEECYPNQLTILENAMFAGTTEALPLEDDKKLRLSHELFKIDGIFMNRIADEITLKCDKDPRFVTVKYSGFPYLGIWQEYASDTPFICVEPWCGLPDYEGLSRDIMKKNDMFHINPGASKSVSYSIIFG